MSGKRRGAQQVGTIVWRQLGKTSYAVAESATYRTGDESDLPYFVEITIENATGIPTCTRLTVERRPNGPPVNSDDLRKVPIGRLVEHFGPMLVMQLHDPDKGIEGGMSLLSSRPAVRGASKAVEADATAGRRRITDEDLKRFAAVYVEAKAKGRSYITEAALQLGLTADQAKSRKPKAVAAGYIPRGDTS
jgi:hypothetical protein